jgi:hypothetical protein
MSPKRIVAGVLLGLTILAGAPAVASAQPQPACGYFTGYDDCGGGKSKPAIRFQPAPEEPWVYPTEPLPREWIWSPYTSRDKRKFATPPKRKEKDVPKIEGVSSGECNAATPLGCW